MCEDNEHLEEDDEDAETLSVIHSQCDGCGFTGPDVYGDGYGFNICTRGTCDQYSVRGISRSDFY